MKNDRIPTGKSMLKWLKANVPNFNPDIFLVQNKGNSSNVPAVIILNGKLTQVELPTNVEKLKSWLPRFEEYFNGLGFCDKDYAAFFLDGSLIDIFECDWSERWKINEKLCELNGLAEYDRRITITEVDRPKTWKTIADV